MGWYLIILGAILFYGSFLLFKVKNREKLNDIVLYLSAGTLLFFSAMRSVSVGMDTLAYSYRFLEVNQIPLQLVTRFAQNTEQEFGYVVYNKFLSLFFESGQTITVFNSLILIVTLAFVAKKYSPYPWLSMYLFLTFGLYQTSMNVAPSIMAAAIVFLGFNYILNKELFKYVLLILLAMQFHMSAIVFLPMYFVAKIPLTKRKAIILFIGAYALKISYRYFSEYSFLVVPKRYLPYLENDLPASKMLLIFYIIMFALCILLLKKNGKLSGELSLSVWIVYLSIVFMLLGLDTAIFARLAVLFALNFIILIPQVIAILPHKKYRQIVCFTFIVICLAEYLVRMSINNIGSTMPYTFWFKM